MQPRPTTKAQASGSAVWWAADSPGRQDARCDSGLASLVYVRGSALARRPVRAGGERLAAVVVAECGAADHVAKLVAVEGPDRVGRAACMLGLVVPHACRTQRASRVTQPIIAATISTVIEAGSSACCSLRSWRVPVA